MSGALKSAYTVIPAKAGISAKLCAASPALFRHEIPASAGMTPGAVSPSASPRLRANPFLPKLEPRAGEAAAVAP